MLVDRLLSRPCTIVSRADSGEVDPYGNPVEATTTTDTRCELQQVQRSVSQEPATQGELSDELWDLFLPAGTAFGTADALIVDGLTYEAVGDAWHVRHPLTGQESHVQATVRRTA